MFERVLDTPLNTILNLSNFRRTITYAIFNTLLINLNALVILGFIINAIIHLSGKCKRQVPQETGVINFCGSENSFEINQCESTLVITEYNISEGNDLF